MLNFKKKFSGFTLVELIVVITILVILGTIAFLQLGGFTGSARDSARISNLTNLKQGLDFFLIKSGVYPVPENFIEITASGTSIGYQGFAKEQIESIAKISRGGTKDLIDPSMYITYSTNATKTKMQVMTFLEDSSVMTVFVPETFASSISDYSKRYPMSLGDTLGIILGNSGSTLNQPVQETGTGLDLIKTTTLSGYTMIFSKNDTTATVTTSGSGAYTGSLFTFAYNKQDDLIKNKTFASLDSSLVGYWDMETITLSGSQILLKDLSGYGNDGTCYNSGTAVNCGISGLGPQFVDGNGKSGKAMNFDGIDDLVGMDDNSSFDFNDVTLYAKVKHSGVQEANHGGGWRIISQQAGDYILLRINDSFRQDDITPNNRGELNFGLRGGGVSGGVTFTGSNLINNEYNYISVTKGKDIKLYINGNIFGTVENTVTSIINPLNRLVIGAMSSGTDNFNGIIDEIRIYNRALSSLEIQTLYNATK